VEHLLGRHERLQAPRQACGGHDPDNSVSAAQVERRLRAAVSATTMSRAARADAPWHRRRTAEGLIKVLVTGTEGYIGSLLPPLLLERGHELVGVDACFYAHAKLYDAQPRSYELIKEDIRRLRPEHFEGVHAVVHMAELSNDPLGELLPTITYDVNHQGSVHVAETAKAAGVERFVYTSSCSVYGIAEEDLVDEDSSLDPKTAYADCKRLVEHDVSALADDSFSPTFLRNATAYGASPRMRFDIVLNNLAGLARTTGVIAMESDGTPWRPLIHAEDICRAIVASLEAPRERVHDQVLNVGAPGANFQVREIAEVVADVFVGCELSIGERSADNRSYRVSFDRIREVLPEFHPVWDTRQGAEQLRDVFERAGVTADHFASRDFIRLRQIEYLLGSGQLDESLFWRNGDG
jgi:nucleoside-diphosphate-sugar epimerase